MTKTVMVTADLGHLKAYRLLQQEEGESGSPRIELIQTEITDATSHLSELVTRRVNSAKVPFPPGQPIVLMASRTT